MMCTPSVNMALEIFPTNVAVELKMFAEKHSLHCAKIRQGKKITEADADMTEALSHIASFKEKCNGWLSDKSCLGIEKMLEYAGWHAANTTKSETCWRRGSRKGYKSDASVNERTLEQHFQNVVKEKEISGTLAANIRDMGRGAAWFAVNKIFGHRGEAEREKKKFDSHFDKIHGKITVAEILSQRPQIDSEDNATFGDVLPLEIFPLDVAKELKEYAEKAALHCSKKRLGNRGEADADKIEAKDHFHSFQKKCKGLLSDRSCEDIRLMIKNVALYIANKTKSKKYLLFTKRKQYEETAEICNSKFQTKYQEVVNSGEITETLATNLLELGRNAARLATHTTVGRHGDAKRDQANLDSYFNKIHGEVNLVDINFITDEAKILSQRPIVVSEKKMENTGKEKQTMTFNFSMAEGRTHSFKHNIGFNYGIKTNFSAGFANIGEMKLQLSFSFSHSRTFEESTSTGTTKSFEFQLSVPAHSTYVAKGMVHEAEMEIPYELEFDFGGARRKVKGHWKGIACSKATYQVEKKEDPSPAQEWYCNIF